MGSTAADVHPALPPIRTTPPAPAPACSSAASSSTAPAPDAESAAVTLPSSAAENQEQQGETDDTAEAQQQEQETEPTTPTSEGSQLRPPAECPPAPRKPAWARPSTTPAAKRKVPSSAAPSARRAFVDPVARDLTTLFFALPPKKRIRAG